MSTFAAVPERAWAIDVGQTAKKRASNLPMPPRKRDSDDKRVFTSYSRRRADYRYDIAIYEPAPPADGGLFYAQVVNIVQLEGGHTVSVNAALQDAYGATPDEAYSTLEAAIEARMKDQTPLD
jgi:hypothetical protein